MSTKSPNLIRFYEQILDYLWLKNDNGKVVDVSTDEVRPYKVEDKVVLLPTDDNLRNFKVDEELIFHPLREHADRGESDLLRSLRNRFNTRINCSILSLMTDLLDLINNGDLHRALTPEQRELLLVMGVVDPNVSMSFINMCSKHFGEQTNRFFTNIYLKKAGTIHGKKYSRVGIVQFPFNEFLTSGDHDAKEEHVATLRKLYDFIFPEISEDPESYNDYSNSHDAPWLEAFLKTSAKLSSRVSELQNLYSEHISGMDRLGMNPTWLTQFDNLESLRKEIILIPSQLGNNGLPMRGTEEISASTQTKTQPTPRAVQEPVETSLPVPSRLGFDDIQRQPQPAPSSYPYPAPAQPHQPHQPQHYPDPRIPQAPTKKLTSDGKLDISDILSAPPPGLPGPYPQPYDNGWGAQPNPYAPPQPQGPMLYDARTGQYVPDMRYAPLPTAPAPAPGWGPTPGYQPAHPGYTTGSYPAARYPNHGYGAPAPAPGHGPTTYDI